MGTILVHDFYTVFKFYSRNQDVKMGCKTGLPANNFTQFLTRNSKSVKNGTRFLTQNPQKNLPGLQHKTRNLPKNLPGFQHKIRNLLKNVTRF